TFTATLLSSKVYARVCTGTQPSARTTTSSGPESRGRWTISGACGAMTPSFFFPQLTVAFLLDGKTVNTMRTFALGGFGAAGGAAAGGAAAAGAAGSSATATIVRGTRTIAAAIAASPHRMRPARVVVMINHLLRPRTSRRR